jgi:hypothetical protein
MVSLIFRRYRRRAVLRAWSRGELEFAGALGRSARPGIVTRLSRGF